MPKHEQQPMISQAIDTRISGVQRVWVGNGNITYSTHEDEHAKHHFLVSDDQDCL